ncbi:MAG: hypothetical protein ACREBA_11815, partial [Nitrosotalea sp.]
RHAISMLMTSAPRIVNTGRDNEIPPRLHKGLWSQNQKRWSSDKRLQAKHLHLKDITIMECTR